MDTIKKYAISASMTFAGSLLGTLSILILAVPVKDWTAATWYTLVLSMIITSARTAIKAVAEKFIPVRLGGRKQ